MISDCKWHIEYNHLQKGDTSCAHIFLSMWINACMDKEKERRYFIFKEQELSKAFYSRNNCRVPAFLTFLFMKINLLLLTEVFSKVKLIVLYAGQNWSNGEFTYIFTESISIYTMATIHQALEQSF